nr:MAG TPA: putative tail fiber protein [Caudoviricetes sp.]
MSILKSIMHHWNKTTNSYDILHPETESSQITDWHSGIMASLASKTLGTVVDAITTDSVLGKLIKMLLDASGVKYLIDTNGYVCFGSLFGGLIIQWGSYNCNQSTSFPLAFNSNIYNAVATIAADSTDTNNYTVSIERVSNGMFTLNGQRSGIKQSDIYASVVAFGK